MKTNNVKGSKLTILMLLALLVAAVALTSCGRDGDGGSDVVSGGDREVINVTFNAVDFGHFNPQDDEIAAYILERFGLNVEFTNIDGFIGMVPILAAADDLPDVFYLQPLHQVADYLQLLSQGFFAPIPQEMLDRYPNVRQVVETSNLAHYTYRIFGGHYTLPKPDSLDRDLFVADRRGIFYRRDWAAQFGIYETPRTVEEFYDMLWHFTFSNPDGRENTWGLSTPGGGEMRWFFYQWDVDPFNWVELPDGTWTHGMLVPEMIEPLRFFRRLWDDGILDPEFGQLNHVDVMTKFASHTVGAITRNADTDWIHAVFNEQFGAANPDLDQYEVVGLIPLLALDANTDPIAPGYLLDMTSNQFNANISPEAMDRFLEFYNWALSPEGRRMTLGIEGRDWEFAADGRIEAILTPDGLFPNIMELYPSARLLTMVTWGFELHADFTWPNQRYGVHADRVRQINYEARTARNPYAMIPAMAPRLIVTPAKLEADSFPFGRATIDIVMGTAPVEDMWEAMVEEAMALGFRQAIIDVTEWMNENIN